MSFKDIAGNKRVKGILSKALQRQRVPNSLLFTGPKGVGKKEIALTLAKALNCTKKNDDSCETCAPCLSIKKGNFPDVLVIEPVGSYIKIDQIRQVKHLAHLKPMVGRKRVFVVNKAEKMNEEAANSFLKILEEPPYFSHIILITTNPYLILPTIKSRCQTLSFSAISKVEIERILVEKGYKKEQAQLMSLLVRGNLERALSLEWEDIQGKRKEAWEQFSSLVQKKEVSRFVSDFTSLRNRIQRDELEEILEFYSSFCRDFILVKEKGNLIYLLNPDLGENIQKIEKVFSLKQLMFLLKNIDFAIYALHKNVNITMLVSSFYSDIMEGEYV